MTALPAYYNYTSLQPFEEAFSTGWPILTYHKLGPRPRKVRLKGLYVSAPLFDHQLQELAMAGFQSRPLGGEHPCDSGRGKFITLTFDDGFENVLLHGLEPLQKHRFQAIQFLVPGLLGKENVWEQTEGETPERLMDDSQVREWLKAGHAIGAHSCTHPRLTQIPLAQAREEIRTSRMQWKICSALPSSISAFPMATSTTPLSIWFGKRDSKRPVRPPAVSIPSAATGSGFDG